MSVPLGEQASKNAQSWATWPEGASAPNGTVMWRGHRSTRMVTPAMRTTQFCSFFKLPTICHVQFSYKRLGEWFLSLKSSLRCAVSQYIVWMKTIQKFSFLIPPFPSIYFIKRRPYDDIWRVYSWLIINEHKYLFFLNHPYRPQWICHCHCIMTQCYSQCLQTVLYWYLWTVLYELY